MGLYVFALVGSFVHRVAVEHVPCGHGELVHAGSASDGTPAPAPTHGDGPAGDGAHEHDHCVFAGLGHTFAVCEDASTLQAAVWPPLLHTALSAPVGVDIRVDADRYRLAPKGSPPAGT
jgi:hypothetical protein